MSKLGRAQVECQEDPSGRLEAHHPTQLPHDTAPAQHPPSVPQIVPNPHPSLFLPWAVSEAKNRCSLPGSHRKPQPWPGWRGGGTS